MTKWMITWQACFGAISGPRIDAIEGYISGKLEGGLKDGELDAVVEQLATNWNQKEHGQAPGIGLLILSIRNIRKRAQGIDTTEPHEVTQTKRAVCQMPVNDLQRWNAVCDTLQDFRGRVIDACLRSGGFTIPYWAPPTIKHTAQQARPAGERTIAQMMVETAKAIEAEDWRR